MLLLLMFDPNATLTAQRLWDATIEAGGFAIKKCWFQAHCGAPQCLMSLLLGYDETKKHHGWWQVRVSIRWGSRVKANVNDGCIRAVVPPIWPPIWAGLFSVYILGGSSTNPKWIISYIYILSLVLSGISTVNSLTTGVITYLLSGNHQVTTVIIIPRLWRSHDIPHESPR